MKPRKQPFWSKPSREALPAAGDIQPLADSIPALIHTAREAKGGCPERQVPLRG